MSVKNFIRALLFFAAFALHAQEVRPHKIAMLQFSPIVTDYEGTVNRVIELYKEAVKNGATMVVTPELVLPGYPPADLLSDRPEVLERSLAALKEIQKATTGVVNAYGIYVPLVIGHLDRTPGKNGRKIQNTFTIFANGKPLHHYAKRLLPTYNVFDEMRYFEPGNESQIFEWEGVKYGVIICEDWWFMDDHDGRLIYKQDPMDELVRDGADVLISLSASPYTSVFHYDFEATQQGKVKLTLTDKRATRHTIHAERARRANAPIIWVNMTGATDNLVFDGSSFVLDAHGEFVGAMESFPDPDQMNQIGYVTIRGKTKDQIQFDRKVRNFTVPGWDDTWEVVLRAALTGEREYFHRSGNTKSVLGVSGGVDSTISATVSRLALGSKNTTGISMPSKFSPGHSRSDAALLAQNLEMNYLVVAVEPVVEELRRRAELIHEQMHIANGGKPYYARNFLNKFMPRKWAAKMLGELSTGLADENLQARARMIILYNYANQNPGTLVLTTGCKSELAMGWCTKFGDHGGDFNGIGDFFKSEEIALGYYINARQKAMGLEALIPEHMLEKPPSPDLKPNQLTSHTLPPYWILDPLLTDYMIGGFSVQELTAKYGKILKDREPWRADTWVQDVVKRFESPNAESKRDTMPVSTRVSRRQFNQKTRRWPVARVTETAAAPVSCTDPLLQVAEFERRTAKP
jgi:NAD+ synthase (glutamine-hydrolysing)